MLLKISQNLQQNTCAKVFFLIKLQAWRLRFWYRGFPVNFSKFLRTSFLQNTSGGCFCNDPPFANLQSLLEKKQSRSKWHSSGLDTTEDFFFNQHITPRKFYIFIDCNGIRTHNNLVRKRTLNYLVKLASLVEWLSICLRAKWLWVWIPLQSLINFYRQEVPTFCVLWKTDL